MTTGEQRKIWLQENGTLNIYRVSLVGETSRSWLTGYPWRPNKYAKKRHSILSEADGERLSGERAWLDTNKYPLLKKLRWGNYPYGVWREIAELIGYGGPENT